HDIGKISSYEYKTLIDYTDEGRLLGHIVIGAQMVEDKIKSIPDFPRVLKKQLLHLILSHQGKLEQASPVVPMTLEALILYYADEIDSKANAFTRIRNKDKKSGAKWSSFVRLMDRYLYLGEEPEAKPTP
ncbi:HD domain-containing protein, partial [bacterium]|nr:HD domain-containing protein [bacterium]